MEKPALPRSSVILLLMWSIVMSFIPWRDSPYWAKTSSLSGLHDHPDTPHSVKILWTNNQPDAEPSTRRNTTLTRDTHINASEGFELAIPAGERPQTHALDRAAAGNGYEFREGK
jgi:hypothetical protein